MEQLSRIKANVRERALDMSDNISPYAIETRGLGKAFKVWNHPSDILREAVTGKSRHNEFHALTDVSMRVTRGSVVGILGRNGAGKSTLLRIIAGTLDPTKGSVSVDGKIAAILELGSGFHPDYSGRENILLGGMCLGLSKADITQREQSIIDFAELEYAIDQPFRTYSSGMQARLTFAVAMSVRAEIVIIDEALSVGDARFQLKSFDRIKDMKRANKTILFVSHSINQVNSICDEAILLDHGHVIDSGEASAVGNTYHQLLFEDRRSPSASDERVDTGNNEEIEQEPEGQPVAETTPELETATTDVPIEASADAELAPNSIEDLSTGVPDTDNPSLEETPSRSVEPDQAISDTASGSDDEPAAVQSEEPAVPDHSVSIASRSEDEPVLNDAAKIVEASDREHRYGSGRAQIASVSIVDASGREITQLKSLETYKIQVVVESQEHLAAICLGLMIRDSRGMEVFGWDTRDGELDVDKDHLRSPALNKGSTVEANISFRNNMAAGTYFLTAAIAEIDETKLDMRFDAIEFSVHSTGELYHNSIVNLEVGGRHHEEAPTSIWKHL